VLPEEIADLARADADVARGDVGLLAQVPVQFGQNAWQKRITSPSEPPVGSKSEPPFAPADRHSGQGVLEHLSRRLGR
jgi:hypothetical protein